MIPYYTVTKRYRSFHSNIKIEQRFLMGCIDRNYTHTHPSMQTAKRKKKQHAERVIEKERKEKSWNIEKQVVVAAAAE